MMGRPHSGSAPYAVGVLVAAVSSFACGSGSEHKVNALHPFANATDASRPVMTPDGGHTAAEAGPSSSGSQRNESEFVSVTVDLSGGFCSDSCTHVFSRGVEAPGTLVLADDNGREEFKLTADEYQGVLGLVLGPAFSTAMRDPMDCHSVPDAGGRVIVEWTDLGVQSDVAASCLNGRNDSD